MSEPLHWPTVCSIACKARTLNVSFAEAIQMALYREGAKQAQLANMRAEEEQIAVAQARQRRKLLKG